MLKEFRDFINRGNVLDLAVAVVIGAAFTGIVNSFVNDIIMPILGILTGGMDFTKLSIGVGGAQINYGNFIQAVINFLIIAWVIFLIVRAFNAMQRRFAREKEAQPVEPSDEVKLLTEIRDLLRTQADRPSVS